MSGFTNRRARRLTAIAVVALVALLAGCGGDDFAKTAPKAPPSPRKVLLASVRTTASARSARVSLTATSTGTGSESFAISASGVTDLDTGDGQLTMHFGGAASAIFSGGIEVRTVGGAAYVKLPETIGGTGGFQIPGGGKWLKVSDLGAVPEGLPSVDQSDPSRFLASLETVSDSVEKVGTETIRGVDTTHYKATLDLGKAVARADVPPSLRDKLRSLFQTRNGTAASMPADVWVDSAGLLRRIQLKIDLAAFIGGAASESDGAEVVTVVLDMYDFGVPVHIVAPPADQVTTFDFGKLGSPA